MLQIICHDLSFIIHQHSKSSKSKWIMPTPTSAINFLLNNQIRHLQNIEPAFFSCFSHCCRRLNHNNSSQQQCWECRLQHKTPWHTTHSDHVVILFRDEKLEEGNHVFLICINHGYKSNSSRKCHQKYHRVTWLDIIVCNKVLKWRVRWSSEWSRSRSFPPGRSRLP